MRVDGSESVWVNEGAIPAEDALALGQARFIAKEVYEDEHVDVVSDTVMSREAGQKLARRVEAAWAWTAKAQELEHDGPLAKPVVVAALSPWSFEQLTGDSTGAVLGATTSPNVIALPAASARRNTPDDQVVLAHELAHVQDLRDAGARIGRVPLYVQEGKAYVLGNAYADRDGRPSPNQQAVARFLGKVTGSDARDVVDHFRTAADNADAGPEAYRDEVVGALFVEFLRTRFQGGTTDTVPRLAEAIRDVGRGEGWADAFARQFAATPRQAERAFVDWVTRTENDPRNRLSGTLYGPTTSQPPSASPR